MNLKPYSSIVLALGGVILMGLGIYFVFLRPSMLAEDPRYIGTSLSSIQAAVPGLGNWLQKVFWVMGGYMFTTGLLTVYVALTSFRARTHGAFGVIAIAGLTSIGWMSVVNFIINSDFKWLLLAFAILWLFGLMGYELERKA